MVDVSGSELRGFGYTTIFSKSGISEPYPNMTEKNVDKNVQSQIKQQIKSFSWKTICFGQCSGGALWPNWSFDLLLLWYVR